MYVDCVEVVVVVRACVRVRVWCVVCVCGWVRVWYVSEEGSVTRVYRAEPCELPSIWCSLSCSGPTYITPILIVCVNGVMSNKLIARSVPSPVCSSVNIPY